MGILDLKTIVHHRDVVGGNGSRNVRGGGGERRGRILRVRNKSYAVRSTLWALCIEDMAVVFLFMAL